MTKQLDMTNSYLQSIKFLSKIDGHNTHWINVFILKKTLILLSILHTKINPTVYIYITAHANDVYNVTALNTWNLNQILTSKSGPPMNACFLALTTADFIAASAFLRFSISLKM